MSLRLRAALLLISVLASTMVSLLPTSTYAQWGEPGIFLDHPDSLVKWQTGTGQRFRYPRAIGPMQCLLITAAGVQIGGTFVGHRADQFPRQDVVVAVNGGSVGVGANVADVNEGQVDIPKPFREHKRKIDRIAVAFQLANRFSPPHEVRFYVASADSGLGLVEISQEIFLSNAACPADP